MGIEGWGLRGLQCPPYTTTPCKHYQQHHQRLPPPLLHARRDYLQAPLQPLQDNLESQTYEVFERDTIKYTTYQEAVRRALLDRVPEKEAGSRVTVVMVVGAGRAPLVRASLAAAKEAGRLVKVYAVEKNPNAVVTIQHLIESEGWQDLVGGGGSGEHADAADADALPGAC